MAGRRPEELLITARRVPLGKTTEVARALPDRQIRMIGAWCFLDHYGPEDLGGSPGMQVWAHPHTGLQTVSWLLEGEVEHRDSLGSQAMVRPGELNIMTAGHGIVHSEISQPDRPPRLHGVQLWVALPDARPRHARRASTRYADLPDLFGDPGVRGKVLIGELDGVASPADVHTPLVRRRPDPRAGRGRSTLSLDPASSTASSWSQGEVDRGVDRGRPSTSCSTSAPVGRELAAAQRAGRPGDAARRRAVRRGDRDVVELHRPQPRRDRGATATAWERRDAALPAGGRAATRR